MKALKASKQTRLKLRNGFHNAPISYRVLMVAQFTDVDKKEISRGLALAVTPKEAEKLISKPGLAKTKWSLLKNSTAGLVGTFDLQILKFKGLEVAVFWKRQTSEVIPDPSDPVPEGVLESPDDVWARLDLFHKSARQMVGVVAEDLKSLQKQIIAKDVQIESLGKVIEANDKTIASLQGRISKALKVYEPKEKAREKKNGKAE